jgi:hypothetical protein
MAAAIPRVAVSPDNIPSSAVAGPAIIPSSFRELRGPITALGPKGVQLLAEVSLLPGEQLVYAIQGDGYFLGANPLQKFFAKLSALLTAATGGHIRVFLVVTNQRVLLIESRAALCGWARMRKFHAMATASVLQAGSSKETQAWCLHTRTVHIESKTQRHTLVIKKLGDEGLRDFVTNLSAVLVANVHSGTAT